MEMRIMTNEEFQKSLRAETKKLKRMFLKIPDCPKTFRQWNKYKVELKAIRAIMIKHPDISNEEWETLIKLNPTSLNFVNKCLVVVPEMLDMLRSGDYEYDVFDEFYKRRLAKLRETPTKRGRKKLNQQQTEQPKVEDSDEFIK